MQCHSSDPQRHSNTFKKLQRAKAETTTAKAELRETQDRWRQRKVEWQKQSQKHAKLKEKFNQLLSAVRTEKEARTVATAARADSTLESTTAKSSSTPAGRAAVVDSGRPLFAQQRAAASRLTGAKHSTTSVPHAPASGLARTPASAACWAEGGGGGGGGGGGSHLEQEADGQIGLNDPFEYGGAPPGGSAWRVVGAKAGSGVFVNAAAGVEPNEEYKGATFQPRRRRAKR